MRIICAVACQKNHLSTMFLQFGKLLVLERIPIQVQQLVKFHIKCQESPGDISLSCTVIFL